VQTVLRSGSAERSIRRPRERAPLDGECDFGVLHTNGDSVTLQDLTITRGGAPSFDGRTGQNGGDIFNSGGTLTLRAGRSVSLEPGSSVTDSAPDNCCPLDIAGCTHVSGAHASPESDRLISARKPAK
jgi:hypothetical protein